MGESAPRLRSRKNDAESRDAMAITTGLSGFINEALIGGSEDHTLPLRCQNQ